MVHDSVESLADLPICKQPSLSPHKPEAAKQQQRDATHNLATYHTESHTHTHHRQQHTRHRSLHECKSHHSELSDPTPRAPSAPTRSNRLKRLNQSYHKATVMRQVQLDEPCANLPVLPPMRLSPSLSHTPFRNPARPHPH